MSRRHAVRDSASIALALCILSACSSSSSPAQPPADSGVSADSTDDAALPDVAADVAPTADEQATFDALVANLTTKLHKAKVPGGAIAVVLRGKLAFSAGMGVKRDDGTDPVTPDSLFRVASLTKVLVATSMMELVESGQVDLTHPVTEYVPYFKRGVGFDASKVLVEQLLDHTAGIPDINEIDCPTVDGYERTWVKNHGNDPLWSPPGRLFDYSNAGYTIAGVVLDEVTGVSFADRIHDSVLVPAGMTTATFDVGEAMAGDHVTGHYLAPGGPTTHYELNAFHCASLLPWAGAIATVKDYAHLAEMMLMRGAGVLKPTSVHSMEAAQIATGWDPATSYGYGMLSYDYRGLSVVGHDGRLEGYRTSWVLVPSKNFAVAVFLNGDPSDPNGLALDAVDAFLQPTGAITDYRTDPSTWNRYVGTYKNPYTSLGDMKVTLAGKALSVELVGKAGTARLYQIAGDEFYFTVPGATYTTDVTFVLDSFGQGEYFVTRQGVGHRDLTAPAVSPPPSWPDEAQPLLRPLSERMSLDGRYRAR